MLCGKVARLEGWIQVRRHQHLVAKRSRRPVGSRYVPGARIEGSKVFSKDLMERQGVPTARSAVFESAHEARDFRAGIHDSTAATIHPGKLARGRGAAWGGTVSCQRTGGAQSG